MEKNSSQLLETPVNSYILLSLGRWHMRLIDPLGVEFFQDKPKLGSTSMARQLAFHHIFENKRIDGDYWVV